MMLNAFRSLILQLLWTPQFKTIGFNAEGLIYPKKWAEVKSITKNGSGKIGIDGDQMTDKKDPIVVTIKKKQTEEEAMREKEREKQLELIEKIENEEKTHQQEPDSISKDNAGNLKPGLVMPYVITTKKEQTEEQAIRLTKIEHSNPSELIERIEKEEKTKSENDEN